MHAHRLRSGDHCRSDLLHVGFTFQNEAFGDEFRVLNQVGV